MTKYIIEIAKEYEEYFKGVLICGIADGKFAVDIIAREDLEELNSDYINEHCGSLQDEAYKQGYADAERIWRAPSSDNEFYQKGYDAGIIASSYVDKSDEAYQRGLEDAWEAARKLFSSMADSDIEKAFPIEWNNGGFKALMNLQPQEAIAKLKAYEEHKDDSIKVGDIVDRYFDGEFDNRGIYLGGDDEMWVCLFWANSLPITLAYPKEQFKKTGKHYDIQSILEAMRE